MRASPSSRASYGVGLGTGVFVITMAAFFRPPLLPDLGRDLGMSALGLGALGSVFAFGRLLADLPAARFTDRVSPGPMMVVAGVLVAAGSALLAAAPTASVAFLAVGVLGLGSAWVTTTGMAWFAGAPRQQRGMSMSLFAGSLLAGQSLGPTTAGAVASVWGWRIAMGAAGLLALAVAVVFVRYRRPANPANPATPAASPASPPPDPAVPKRPGARATPAVLAVLYLLPAIQFAVGGALMQTLLPIVADRELGFGPGLVGLALGAGGVTRFVGVLASGRVADRVGRRWALFPGLVLEVAGLAVFALAGTIAWLLTILLTTVGSVMVNVGTTILADLTEGTALGRRLGAFRFTGDAAFMAAPVMAGFLYETHGRWAAVLPLVVLTAGVLLASVVLLPETLEL